jgi:hypothetical protein
MRPPELAVDPTTASRRRDYPSVSLLVPLEGNWRARLRGLQRAVIARLRAEPDHDVERLLQHLDAAVATAAAPGGARSLAVFVSADGAECVPMIVPVRERAVIDDTFATRDLVHHNLRSPGYWVLALSLEQPRLLYGRGSRLHQRPLDVGDTVEHASGARDRRARDRSDVVDVRRVRRLRAVDMALGESLARNSDPLLVVGNEPTLSRFLACTRHVHRIEGVVRRAADHDLDVLSRVVEPAVADMLGERRVSSLASLDHAVGAGTAVSGVDQVWRQARRARGALLLVEQDFEHPARIRGDGTLEPAADATVAGVVDDIVDDIIEIVLASDGRVEIVPNRALAAHQRIALVAPWRGKQ